MKKTEDTSLSEANKLADLARADLKVHEIGIDTGISRKIDNALNAELQELNKDPNYAKQVIAKMNGLKDCSSSFVPDLKLDEHNVDGTYQHSLTLKLQDGKANITSSSGLETESNHGVTTTQASTRFEH